MYDSVNFFHYSEGGCNVNTMDETCVSFWLRMKFTVVKENINLQRRLQQDEGKRNVITDIDVKIAK